MNRFHNSGLTRLTFGVLLLAMIATPLSPVAAQTNDGAADLEEQLSYLEEQIDALGNQISFSERIDPYQRLALLQQLIALSTQILELQRLIRQSEEASEESVTADEVGLEQVVVSFTPDDPEATVELTYLTADDVEETETLDFTITDVTPDTEFGTMVAEARQQAVEVVAAETAITNQSINERLYVSARNPAFDTWLAMEPDDPAREELGEELFAQFGANSIVEEVLVFPGDGLGTILIITDQNEVLETKLELTSQSRAAVEQYRFTYAYYVLEPGQRAALYPTTPAPDFEPAYSEVEEELEKLVLYLTIQLSFDHIPFVEEIQLFDRKFVQFLVENETVLQLRDTAYGEVPPLHQPLQCIPQNDRVVMEGFTDSLVDELGVQHSYDLPTRFFAPLRFNLDRQSATCGSVTRVF